MTEELDILKIIAANPSISQRKIAERTGISLGQVNFLIKKCVRKGLVKIEGQTSKSLQYNLTPQGMSEKAKLTLEYIKVSYSAVITLTDKVRSFMNQYKQEGYSIYVYGSQDEMMEIVKLAMGNECSGYIVADKQNSHNGLVGPVASKTLMFYWEDDLKFGIKDYKTINVLG
jgi:DNA-binding MarR family transcriptional regulator